MSGFVCPHCGKRTDLFKTGGGEKAAGEMNVAFLGRIPFEPEIVSAGDEGKPFIWEQKESTAAKIFTEMVERIREDLGTRETSKTRGGD